MRLRGVHDVASACQICPPKVKATLVLTGQGRRAAAAAAAALAAELEAKMRSGEAVDKRREKQQTTRRAKGGAGESGAAALAAMLEAKIRSGEFDAVSLSLPLSLSLSLSVSLAIHSFVRPRCGTVLKI